MSRAVSLQPVLAGLVTAVVGFAGAFAVVLTGLVTPYAGASKTCVKKWLELKVAKDSRWRTGFGYGADANGPGQAGPAATGNEKNPVSSALDVAPPVAHPDNVACLARDWFASFGGSAQLGVSPSEVCGTSLLVG